MPEVMEALKKTFQKSMIVLEKAATTAMALPAMIDGDVGLIEGEIQPSAPVMQRRDGSSIRDRVWAKLVEDRSRGNLPRSRGAPCPCPPCPPTSSGAELPPATSLTPALACSQ